MKKNTLIIICAICFVLGVARMVGTITYAHKTINSMDDTKIEYKIKGKPICPSISGGYRNVYWRVSQDELRWWLKPYNKWHQAYFVESGYEYSRFLHGELNATKYVLFNTEQFKKMKDKCHTLGEMKEYIKKSDEEFNKCNYKVRRKREEEERKKRSENMWKEIVND